MSLGLDPMLQDKSASYQAKKVAFPFLRVERSGEKIFRCFREVKVEILQHIDAISADYAQSQGFKIFLRRHGPQGTVVQ